MRKQCIQVRIQNVSMMNLHKPYSMENLHWFLSWICEHSGVYYKGNVLVCDTGFIIEYAEKWVRDDISYFCCVHSAFREHKKFFPAKSFFSQTNKETEWHIAEHDLASTWIFHGVFWRKLIMETHSHHNTFEE